jgi:hypothetical protein
LQNFQYLIDLTNKITKRDMVYNKNTINGILDKLICNQKIGHKILNSLLLKHLLLVQFLLMKSFLQKDLNFVTCSKSTGCETCVFIDPFLYYLELKII